MDIGAIQLESTFAEKDCGSHLCALVAKMADGILDCIRKHGQQVEGGDPFCLLSAGEATPGILYVWFWVLQYKRDMDVLERVQQRTKLMMKGLEHL